MPDSTLVQPCTADHADFLRDESRKSGRAESISFPSSAEEVREVLRHCHRAGLPVTVQGARTGISAGAVPDGGHLLNLGRMDRLTGLRRDAAGVFFLRAEPGVRLEALRAALAGPSPDTAGWSAESLRALDALRAAGPHWFPPDPTETTASIGGMVSTNASGALSHRYGPTRRWVQELEVLLADGAGVRLRRGAPRARSGAFVLPLDDGRSLAGRLPAHPVPAIKNAAGYQTAPGMDLLDLFVGGEGTLGVVTEIEVRLAPAPAVRWGCTAFFPEEAAALRFVRLLRRKACPVAAVEYFNHAALALLRGEQAGNPAFQEIPAPPPDALGAVYVEIHAADEDAAAEALLAAAEHIAAAGGAADTAWTATTPRELDRLHAFRHATPEIANLRIDRLRRAESRLTKLGTDMAVPDADLEWVLELYNRGIAAAGLDAVIFGHVGDNHLHVNLLPRTLEEYETGRALHREWARQIVRRGGTVSAEHGIGKLKVPLLALQLGAEGLAEMAALRRLFDPAERLGRGNLYAFAP